MTVAVAAPKERPGWLLAMLIGGTLIGIAGFGVSLVAVVLAPMAFDSGETPAAWTVFIILVLLPFIPLIGIAVGWTAFGLRATKTAIFGLALMLVPAVLAMMVFR